MKITKIKSTHRKGLPASESTYSEITSLVDIKQKKLETLEKMAAKVIVNTLDVRAVETAYDNSFKISNNSNTLWGRQVREDFKSHPISGLIDSIIELEIK